MPVSVTTARPATSSSSAGLASDTLGVSDTCGTSKPRRCVKRQCSSAVVGRGSSSYRFAASSRVIVFRPPGAAGALTDTAFHLELDQPVHLDGVFERQLLRD